MYIWYAECRPLGVIYVREIKSDRSDRIAYFMQHLKGLEAAYTRVCSRSKFYSCKSSSKNPAHFAVLQTYVRIKEKAIKIAQLSRPIKQHL